MAGNGHRPAVKERLRNLHLPLRLSLTLFGVGPRNTRLRLRGRLVRKLLAYPVSRANPVRFKTVPKKTKTPSKDTEVVPAAADLEINDRVGKTQRRVATKAKKTPAKKALKQSTAKTPSHPVPSEEEIRIRAYFISERRHRLALPGDATSDWEEARRQLLSELGPR